MPSSRHEILAAAVSVAATLLAVAIAEVGLRSWERLRPRLTGEVADYGDVWRRGGLGEAGFLAEGFAGRVRDGYGGTVRWANEASGFRRDRPVPRERRAGSLRILSLGDSFTAGYRVGQEETFSHLLEEHLQATRAWSDVEVLIAVIEEPATGLLYLERHGLGWKPDLVLLGLTLGNDVAQAYVSLDPRGELRLERAGEVPRIVPNPGADQEALVAELRRWTLPATCFDPAAASPPAPPAEPEHEGLRLIRLAADRLAAWREREAPQAVTSLWGEYRRPRLFDNNGLGIYLAAPPPEIRRTYRRLFAALGAYQELTAAHEIGFAVALFPQRFQVQPRDWRATTRAYGLEPGCFDLAAPNRRIGAFCRRQGIPYLDATPALARRFAASGRSLYLPRGDMHWNARGHRAFFDAVRAPVEELVLGRAHSPVPPAPATTIPRLSAKAVRTGSS